MNVLGGHTPINLSLATDGGHKKLIKKLGTDAKAMGKLIEFFAWNSCVSME